MLEDLLALGITWIIGKVINVVLIVTLTQGTKIIIKRIVKTITYKEGKDKMKVLKKIGNWLKNAWVFVWNNKLTGIMVSVGVYAAYSFYLASYLPYLWANIIGAIVIGLVASILSIRFGGETLTQIIDRVNATKLTREEKKQAKLAAMMAKEELAKIEAKIAEIKAKKDAEEKAKLEAEAKTLILAEKNNNDVQ